MSDPETQIKERAKQLGFDVVGITTAQHAEHEASLLRWLYQGFHGEMDYLARDPERRARPSLVLENAKSIIAVGLNYYTKEPEPEKTTTGKVSRYAWGDDYHRVMQPKLKRLCRFISEIGGQETSSRYYVDTGPILEREFAARAGLGWIGKHSNLVSMEFGSWLFLGVVLTTLELEPDTPITDHCGTCRACLDACPTNAFPAPYILDARKCISYLTIEHRGSIPETLRGQMGNHVYGCDICLQICPWNRHQKQSGDSAFDPRDEWHNPRLVDLLQLDEQSFQEATRKNPIRRTKLTGMLRNACIAAGNSKKKEFLPALTPLQQHENPAIREHATWAMERIKEATGHT